MYSGSRCRRLESRRSARCAAVPAIEPSSVTFSALYPASPASNVRSSQKITKRSRARAMRSTMSGRSARSALSTSISRRPLLAYRASMALTSDDLPVPREPVSSTLFAGSPATNCRVFGSMQLFLCVHRHQRSRRIAWGRATSCRIAAPPRLRQREAARLPIGGRVRRRQQTFKARQQRFGVRDQRRAAIAPDRGASGTVIRVDGDVVVREVAGPHGGVHRQPLPRPRSTRTPISACVITRCPSSSRYVAARPPRSTTRTSSSQNETAPVSRSAGAALPMAQTIRPRFGSDAKNAVLTSGEWAMPERHFVAFRRHRARFPR